MRVGLGGLIPDRRRRAHHRRAPRRRDLVPGQRPPDRQGVVHVPGHRAGGPRGRLQRHPAAHDDQAAAATTWTWDAAEPMASYLATASIGQFDITAYKADGLALLGRHRPRALRRRRAARARARSSRSRRSGRLVVQAPDAHDHRPGRRRDAVVLGRPRHRAGLGLRRSSRPTPPARDDWTTLPDVNGHTSARHRRLVPVLAGGCPPVPRALPDRQRRRHLHPDRHDRRRGGRPPGQSDGYEQWKVDLSRLRRARRSRCRSPTPATTSCRLHGVFIDDIAVSTGEGTTSFEDDGDTLDGWTVPGAPAGQPGQRERLDRRHRGRRCRRRSASRSQASFAREPEIIELPVAATSAATRSATPAASSTTLDGLGFALENQTRPIYAQDSSTTRSARTASSSTSSPTSGTATASRVARWSDIWLNEGFATYAEWLWSEHEGLETPQEIFDFSYAAIPADDPFWQLVDRRPGPGPRSSTARSTTAGAMTLHAAAVTVGDDAFFRILRTWASAARRQRHDRRVHRARRARSPARISTRSSRPGCSRPASRTCRRRRRRSRVPR